MPTWCAFSYERPESVYYSGDVLNGKAILSTDEVQRVRGITITISGTGKVQWIDRGDTSDTMVTYRGHEKYLNHKVCVKGEGSLTPGAHEYPFSTQLSARLPSSITGEFGNVSYEVELRLVHYSQADVVYRNYFTVLRPLNLNMDQSFLKPVLEQNEKYFCCWFCKTGPMKSELRTEYSGYVPGQNINFTIFIDNESNQDVSGCAVEFYQKVAFRSNSPDVQVKNVEQVLGEAIVDGVFRFIRSYLRVLLPASESRIWLFNRIVDLRADIVIGTVAITASAGAPNSSNVVSAQPSIVVQSDDEDNPPPYRELDFRPSEENTETTMPFIDEQARENRNRSVPMHTVNYNFVTPSAPEDEEKQFIQGSRQTT